MPGIFHTLKQKTREINGNIAALYLAVRRTDVPLLAKIVAFLATAYALSPLDLIPDFIPVLGCLDDIIILPLLITLAIKIIPENIFNQCKREAEELWRGGKPKRWYYALPVIIMWLMIGLALVGEAGRVLVKKL